MEIWVKTRYYARIGREIIENYLKT
jgi:hypothetical protein